MDKSVLLEQLIAEDYGGESEGILGELQVLCCSECSGIDWHHFLKLACMPC